MCSRSLRATAASLARCQSGHPAGVLAPRSFPRRAEVLQQWRPGAVLSEVHLGRHCGLHRAARAPQRGAPRAAAMVPRSAARTAPSGRRAGVTETARSPRPQSQLARPADSASRHRQETKVSRQRIIKALCCSSTAWSEQKQREHRAHDMGFLEVDTSPFAYDPTSGPMSGYFNALPYVTGAGIPKAALSRSSLARRRWGQRACAAAFAASSCWRAAGTSN